MATSRPRRVSRARYTSPMPPAPMRAMTSYGPSRVPACRGMCWRIIRAGSTHALLSSGGMRPFDEQRVLTPIRTCNKMGGRTAVNQVQ